MKEVEGPGALATHPSLVLLTDVLFSCECQQAKESLDIFLGNRK